MSDFMAFADAFHLIRPWWLALIPIILFLWWRIRFRSEARQALPSVIAPHLAAALTIGGSKRSRIVPIDSVALAAILLVGGVAGPSWSRIPNPLVADTAPLVIALKVTDSMLETDIAPSRLERAKQKILDVVQSRAGAKTALIAFAGSAHRVTPLTEDPQVLKPFVEGLTPDVMPDPGNDIAGALEVADNILQAEEVSGAILFVLDDMDQAGIAAIGRHAETGGGRIVILAVTGDNAASERMNSFRTANVVAVTPDGSDVSAIGRRVEAAYREALDDDNRLKWADRGWILAWPAALILLFWFRRGWTMQWSAILFIALLTAAPGGTARADGIADWFLTPDQQGFLAYRNKDYRRAADLFHDPMWRGYALFRAGDYEEAAKVFAQQPSADAAFAEGMAQIRSRGYRPAIAAFEKALKRDPGNAAAARNLEIARAILDYVEETREQSDTGEDSGIGADDVVFDNEAAKGTQTIVSKEDTLEMQTADQWMRTVETRTSDFLKLRFALEAQESNR